MERYISEFNEKDIETIKSQLNSDTVRMVGVAERCIFGYPSIIIQNPYKECSITKDTPGESKLDHAALSTMLWLTCPYLNKKIHDLESKGYITKIEDFIDKDRELQTLMNSSHANYYHLRKTMQRFIGRERNISPDGCAEKFFSIGIGGIQEIKHLKCLHLHYAHFRIYENNIAGKLAYLLLDKNIYCEEEVCSCAKN